MGVAGYEELGDPLADWSPSKQDKRRQAQSEQLRHHAHESVKDLPPLAPESIKAVASVLSHATPAHELMLWRLRLYCGHLVERSAHFTHKTVHAAFMASTSCPDCGLGPATIVAAEAIGLVSEPPHPIERKPVAPRRAKQIEQLIARREREIMQLREELRGLR
jgi:hypothetical protein